MVVLPFDEPSQLGYVDKSFMYVLFVSLKVVIIMYESKKHLNQPIKYPPAGSFRLYFHTRHDLSSHDLMRAALV